MVDRRSLLLAGAAGLLLPGCGAADKPVDPHSQKDTGTEREGDIEVVNAMLELELRSAAAYARQSGLLGTLHEQERAHAQRLADEVRRLGGRPVAEPARWPGEPSLEFALKVEDTTFAAYLDALPKIVDGRVRGVVAAIAATEAEQLAAVHAELGTPEAMGAFVTGARRL